jgi:hypothetical protein
LNTNVFESDEATELSGQDASEVVLLKIESREPGETAKSGRQGTTQKLILFNT